MSSNVYQKDKQTNLYKAQLYPNSLKSALINFEHLKMIFKNNRKCRENNAKLWILTKTIQTMNVKDIKELGLNQRDLSWIQYS